MKPSDPSGPALPAQAPTLTPLPVAPPATRLLLIRHAEVEASYQGVFGGRIDMDLSPRGHDQAATLARYLHAEAVERDLCQSDEARPADAGPLLLNGAPKPVILPDLREVDFGDWTGLSWDQVQAKFGVSAFSWLDHLECGGIANAECGETFRERVEPCLERILADHAGEQVAVFCHGGVIRMVLSILLRWPLSSWRCSKSNMPALLRSPCSRINRRLQLLNFAPWRDMAS